MEGYVYVDPPALTDGALKAWLQMALDFVQTLPAKKPKAKPMRSEGKPR